MNKLDCFKLEYKLSRFQYGIGLSFLRAVKEAFRKPAF
jgi:hypothetical protein